VTAARVTLRPYLPGPRLGRATLRAVPRRRGRPPAADAAERRSQAAAIVAAEPAIAAAELARRPLPRRCGVKFLLTVTP
jgi:hypothetical protein